MPAVSSVQRDQRSLAVWQSVKVFSLEVFRDEIVEPVFTFFRGELETGDGDLV